MIMTLQERREEISYDFFESDRIWPPTITSNSSHPFNKAFQDVLIRLPEQDYNKIVSHMRFVVEDPRILAINVPFNHRVSLKLLESSKTQLSLPETLDIRVDTIVFFHSAMEFSHKALVGLIAHEIAHSFVNKPDYRSDEQAADAQSRKWGFQEEMEALQVEIQRLAQKQTSISK
jgi:hypothetical protein